MFTGRLFMVGLLFHELASFLVTGCYSATEYTAMLSAALQIDPFSHISIFHIVDNVLNRIFHCLSIFILIKSILEKLFKPYNFHIYLN